MMQYSGTPTQRRRTTIPLGTFERRRNTRLYVYAGLALVLLMGLAGYSYSRRAQRHASMSSDPTVNTECGGDRGNPFGTPVGALDGVVAYSNCNDNIISLNYALVRPNGDVCATVDESGPEGSPVTISYTPLGERMRNEWENYNRKRSSSGKKKPLAAPRKRTGEGPADDGAPAEAKQQQQQQEDEAAVAPAEPTATSSSTSTYVCGVRTGMLWQCVEYARRYWFMQFRAIFGSIDGAEDIFKLRYAEVLSDDCEGEINPNGADGADSTEDPSGANANALPLPTDGRKRVGWRHMEAYPNHGTTQAPRKGDQLIWRRQRDMPYGHVGIVAAVELLDDGRGGRLGVGGAVEAAMRLEGVDGGAVMGDPRYAMGSYDDGKREARVLERLQKDVEESFVKKAQLDAAAKGAGDGGDFTPLDSPALVEALAASRTFLRTHIPIGIVGVADQNYHSESWGGKSFHRYLVLLRDETHATEEGDRYALLDPAGYAVLGWVRLGEAVPKEEEGLITA